MIKPLNNLERFELMQLIYPEKLGDNSDMGDDVYLLESMGVDVDAFDEIMGRVAMCAMPMVSPLSGEAHHVFGEVSISNGQVNMTAAVKRGVK